MIGSLARLQLDKKISRSVMSSDARICYGRTSYTRNITKNPARVTLTWAIIGIFLLLIFHLSDALSEETKTLAVEDSRAHSSNTSTEELTWTLCGTKSLTFIDVALRGNGSLSENTTSMNVSEECLLRPKCDETSGCNTPLHCFDFSKSENGTSQFASFRGVVLVTPRELERIVEDTAVQNVCAIVLFYAPWCTFSVQFARKFNALGRSFTGLPILALNLAESEPYVKCALYIRATQHIIFLPTLKLKYPQEKH